MNVRPMNVHPVNAQPMNGAGRPIGRVTTASSLNAARRAADLDALAGGEVVDLLVIGGGVTGAGTALDAASRGLSVALVEKSDLASGTSRWSSKLVHGGLRYLSSGSVGLAMESARERGILMERTAPHLVRPMPMLVPLTVAVTPAQGRLVAAGGLVGDSLRLLAGTRRATLPRPRRLSAVETARLVPALSPQGLRGGYLYWDGQLEDDARLVVTLARTAAAHGARVVTYCRVVSADGTGATCVDELTGAELVIRARSVVNATGVWADQLAPETRLQPSKGAHLVVRSSSLGNPTTAFTVPVPGASNRYVFALPQPDGVCLIGLTDDPLEGEVPDVPLADERDEAFLLGTISSVLTRPLVPGDVVGSFAGLRPLLAGETGSTADLSRRHAILSGRDGLVTVVGGKLTTYRRMAQDAVDRVLRDVPGLLAGPCRTTRLPLVGATSRSNLANVDAPARLVRRYGAEAPAVAALADGDATLLEPLAEGVPTMGVELLHGIAHEGALTVEDLLERRVRLDFVPADRERVRPTVEQLLAAATRG